MKLPAKLILFLLFFLAATPLLRADNFTLTQESLDLENGFAVWSASTKPGYEISGFHQYEPTTRFSSLLDFTSTVDAWI